LVCSWDAENPTVFPTSGRQPKRPGKDRAAFIDLTVAVVVHAIAADFQRPRKNTCVVILTVQRPAGAALQESTVHICVRAHGRRIEEIGTNETSRRVETG
jgi:hypothetical protein